MKKALYSLIGIAVLCSCSTQKVAVSSVPHEPTPSENEVVDLGFMQESRANSTYGVASITPEENEIATYGNILEYMKSRVAGVNITGAGSDYKITIRGAKSLNASDDPLILLDGIEIHDILSVNPSDVHSISVVKDAAAAMYGSRGANGVILIKTSRAVQMEAEQRAAIKAEREARKAARKAKKK